MKLKIAEERLWQSKIIYIDYISLSLSPCHRYCNLEDPMSKRLQQLENSLLLHTFNHNIEEELNWITERKHQSENEDLGKSLTEVQTISAKHQV